MNRTQEFLVIFNMLQHIDQHHRITREGTGNTLRVPVQEPYFRISSKLLAQYWKQVLGRLDMSECRNLGKAQEALRERSDPNPHLYDLATEIRS
jgi:hypothetical protein